MKVGANERSWHVNEPLGSFDQIRLPKIGRIWPKLPKTAVFRNMNYFPGYFFVTDGRLDVGVGANEGIGVYICLLAVFFPESVTGSWPNMAETI